MITTEKRAQLYLPFQLYQEVIQAAKAKGTSFAHLVREALEHYLKKTPPQRDNDWAHDPLDRLAGFFKGDKTLSSNVDTILYGTKSNSSK